MCTNVRNIEFVFNNLQLDIEEKSKRSINSAHEFINTFMEGICYSSRIFHFR